MKLRISLVSVFMLFALYIQAQSNVTVKFIALGNCGQCKDRIEAALYTVDGVSYANWEYSTDAATVTYDMLTTDIHEVMKIVADTGHDTEWYQSPQFAYDLLRGTCCEYTRTIDYESVQIGYLSLMGIWETVLAVEDDVEPSEVAVYPTITNDYVNIKIENAKESSYILTLYSMDGRKVKEIEINSKESNTLNIADISAGLYVLGIQSEHKVIYSSKIIKQ